MRGWLVVLAVLSLGGCNCLEPVAEGGDDAGRKDAGGGGGAGGGTGGGPQCTTAAGCTGALPSQSLCSFGLDAGFSCIQERCVFECIKGRTCAFDAGPTCLTCSPAPACPTSGCSAATMQGQVESSTCTVGFTDVMLAPQGTCKWSVTDATGAKGTMALLSTGQYVGTFTGLGTCVGLSQQTQVERVLFSCEGCQFVLRI